LISEQNNFGFVGEKERRGEREGEMSVGKHLCWNFLASKLMAPLI
jgi:hypothetical protein